MLACLVLRRERLCVTVELEALCVTLDGMSLSLALGLLTCSLKLLSVELWHVCEQAETQVKRPWNRVWLCRIKMHPVNKNCTRVPCDTRVPQ